MPIDKKTQEAIRRAAQEAEAEGKLGPPPESEDESAGEEAPPAPGMEQGRVRPPQSSLDRRGNVAQLVGLLVAVQQIAHRMYTSSGVGEEHGVFLMELSRHALRAEAYASSMLANYSYSDEMAVQSREGGGAEG